MEKNAKIYVAGHRGMVGSAIVRELQRQGYTNIITRTHKELDLTRQEAVERFFAEEKPEYVFLAAAKVGGIIANQSALADFMYENMILEMNVIHSAWRNGCRKLEFLGSSCIYPRMAPQPMPESCLLTSELEKTNEAYALAKISGLKYCEFLNHQYGTDYISVMPTNLYGPNDNYHPEHSHVLPALIRRFHEAKEAGLKEVTCWGDGSPLRGIPLCGRPCQPVRVPDEQLQWQRNGQCRDRKRTDHKGTDRISGKDNRLHRRDTLGHLTAERYPPQAA